MPLSKTRLMKIVEDYHIDAVSSAHPWAHLYREAANDLREIAAKLDRVHLVYEAEQRAKASRDWVRD